MEMIVEDKRGVGRRVLKKLRVDGIECDIKIVGMDVGEVGVED